MYKKFFVIIFIFLFLINIAFLKAKEKINSKYFKFEKTLYEIGRIISNENISNDRKNYILSMKNSIISNNNEILIVIMYHGFYEDEKDLKTKYSVLKSDFEEHLKILKEFGFEPVSLLDIYYYLKFNKKIPERSVYLTFDDGFKSFMKVYDLIKKYEFKGGISLITKFVNSHWTIDLDDISLLKKEGYIDFISHSHETHNYFKKLVKNKDYRTIKTDIKKSKEFFNSIDIDIFSFSYPLSSGADDKNIHKILEELGFKIAFGGFSDFIVKNDSNIYNIPRIEISIRNGLNKKENFKNLISNIVKNQIKK